MNFLRDTTVFILGLGDSGLAMARWCVHHGALVTVWDSRAVPPGLDALRTELPQVQVLTGDLQIVQLQGVQLLLKSPGLSPSDPRVQPLLDEARAIGIAIGGLSGRSRRLQSGFTRSFALSMLGGAALVVFALVLVRL